MAESKYEVKEQLGHGAFGAVYLALKKDSGEKFATKFVEDVDPTVTEIEVKILRQIQHPHIVKYVESYYTRDGKLAIVMEYAYRGTMETSVKNHGHPDHEFWVWRVIFHISSALNYLHHLRPQHVLQRDLKPANVLGLNNAEKKENRVSWKLADFGIAKLLNKNAQGKYYASTQTGYLTYMAPEVCSSLSSNFGR